MIYGSAIKNYSKARDIDIMMILKESDYKEVSRIIEKRQKILPKKIHSIELTSKDFLENVKSRKKAIVDIIRNAVVLFGQEKYVGALKDVARF